MARNTFQLSPQTSAQLDGVAIQRWFEQNDFIEAIFDNDIHEVTTFSGGNSLYYRLKQNPGFSTYYKSAFGGALLVFEVKLEKNVFECQCYAPVLLFGFIHRELTFKEKASIITRYRKEGYQYMTKLQEFAGENIRSSEN